MDIYTAILLTAIAITNVIMFYTLLRALCYLDHRIRYISRRVDKLNIKYDMANVIYLRDSKAHIGNRKDKKKGL